MPEMSGKVEQKAGRAEESSEVTLSPSSNKRLRNHNEIILSGIAAKPLDLSGPGGNERDDQGRFRENLVEQQSGKRLKCDDNIQLGKGAESKNLSMEVVENISEEIQPHILKVEKDMPFHCKVCNVRCTSKKDYETHCAGKKHTRAVVGEVAPHLSKPFEKSAAGSKAKEASPPPLESVPTEQQAIVHTTSANLHQADKGHLSSCEGCTDIGDIETQVFRVDIDKDSVLKHHDKKAGLLMEPSAFQNVSAESEMTVHDHDNGNIVTANGVAKCDCCLEDKNILDVLRCISRSDTIARALLAAYKVCACPGLENILKSNIRVQPGSQGASNTTDGGTVTMHTNCFINLLHDVQVKGMEGLFLHVMREGRLKGFMGESLHLNGLPVSAVPSAEKDQELSCLMCRVEYGSKSDLDRHVTGRKHISLVARMHSRCHVCNVNCTSEKEYEIHVNGKKHASKLRLAQKRATF